MPTTDLGYPYPSLTAAPNVPGDLQALAEAVEAACFGHASLKANQSVLNATFTALTVATTTPTNLGGFTNPTTTRIAVPKTGLYLVNGQIDWTSNTTGARFAAIVKNSAGTYPGVPDAKELASDYRSTSASGDTIQNLSRMVMLTAGDYVELWGFQSSTISLVAVGSANANETFLTVALLSAAT